MLFPNRSAVKFLELTSTRFHVSKPAQPDKAIRIIQVAKLSDHRHAGYFLTFDKVPFEKRDQHFAPVGHERVLPKLHDRTTGCRSYSIRGEIHRPVCFPGLSSVIGERLFPMRRRR